MNKFKACMIIGNRFDEAWSTEETDNWSASEECATVAKLAYKLHKTFYISPEEALDIVMDVATKTQFDFRKKEDHMWDDYAKGFIAGQRIGLPTKENLELVKEADALWDNDIEGEYGYYQEVCEEVKKG